MIRFNIPAHTGDEMKFISDAIQIGRLSGDNKYTHLCHEWFESTLPCKKALLTPSGTASLEMAALLADIQPGDEVIMPSYTFVSTANAFLLRGAKIIFVDIRPDTLNIDETLIPAAITEKTRAIVPVHYAGVTCEMENINEIANKNNIFVIEDAAQALMSSYKGQPAGSIGNFGAFSFHETKNYNCGEGGVIFINDEEYFERAEIIREKGTNRSKFFRGEVDKYTWVDIGSSYLLSELGAAYLYAQLTNAEKINNNRLKTWNKYYRAFSNLAKNDLITLPSIPGGCTHNAHLFYLLTEDLTQRSKLLEYLKTNDINAVFHYVPLHSSPMGKSSAVFHGDDKFTTQLSERIVRLPLYYDMPDSDSDKVIEAILSFYE